MVSFDSSRLGNYSGANKNIEIILVTILVINIGYYLIEFRNGRWRSVWTIREEGGQAEITGILKVQVHYYEDGNVQLVSSKEIKDTISKSVST